MNTTEHVHLMMRLKNREKKSITILPLRESQKKVKIRVKVRKYSKRFFEGGRGLMVGKKGSDERLL